MKVYVVVREHCPGDYGGEACYDIAGVRWTEDGAGALAFAVARDAQARYYFNWMKTYVARERNGPARRRITRGLLSPPHRLVPHFTACGLDPLTATESQFTPGLFAQVAAFVGKEIEDDAAECPEWFHYFLDGRHGVTIHTQEMLESGLPEEEERSDASEVPATARPTRGSGQAAQ